MSRLRLRISMFVVGVFTVSAAAKVPAQDVLKMAKQLAQHDFKGWTYGSNAAKKEIDCVQFVAAVVEQCAPGKIDEETRKKILIANLKKAEVAKLAALIQQKDRRIRGVQQALIDAKLGVAVKPNEAQAGDLIQYWMRKKNGHWFGHAAVIETVDRGGGAPKATLFGAHQSLNGIGTANFKLRLIGKDRKVFIVRLKVPNGG